MSKSQIGNAMMRYAVQNKFAIHPKCGWEYFADSLMKLKACACAPERKYCPCPEAKEEVVAKGRCKCGLYWKDYETYLNYDHVNMRMLEVKDGD